jgi:hypothetical protein
MDFLEVRCLKMIMPNCSIPPRHSLFYCGALLLMELTEPETVSSLREKTSGLEMLASYEKFILTLDYLFIIKAITFRDGLIARCGRA